MNAGVNECSVAAVSNQLDWPLGQYVSAPLTLLSWAALRLYVFPAYCIVPAVLETRHMYDVFGSILGWRVVYVCYSFFLVPLVVLAAMHWWWFALLTRKILRGLKKVGSKPKAA